jgi:hypothetical protein
LVEFVYFCVCYGNYHLCPPDPRQLARVRKPVPWV